MIGLTRTSGEPCRLHPAQMERIETHPCTTVYLSDGAKYAVVEEVEEILRRVRECRATAMVSLYRLVDTTPAPPSLAVVAPRSRREP